MSKNPPRDTEAGRAQPFPSNPRRPTLFGLYMTNPELQSWHYIGFAAKYAAAMLLDQIQSVQGKFTFQDSDMHFDTGWIVSTRGATGITLKDLLTYEPTRSENEWKIPDNVIQQYRILRNKSHDQDDIPKPITKPDTNSELKEKPKPRPKTDNSDRLSIATLAEEANMTPSRARSILRSKNIEKPYEWSQIASLPILEILKKAHR